MKKQGNKKWIIITVVLAFILVAFAGCGGGNADIPAQDNNVQANNPAATNPPANNQQESNPTTTPPPTDNTPEETSTAEPEDNQPPTERRELTSVEYSNLARYLMEVRAFYEELGGGR